MILDDIQKWLMKGDKLTKEKKFDLALECFSKVTSFYDLNGLKKDKMYFLAEIGKGNVQVYLKNYQEAIHIFDEILKIDSNYSPALYYKGWTYFSLKNSAKALECIEKAREIDSSCLGKDKAGALNRIGSQFQFIDDWENSIKYFKESLDEYERIGSLKGQYSVYYNMARTYYHSGEYDQALQYLQKAYIFAETIDDSDAQYQALDHMKHIYKKRGDKKQLIALQKKIVSLVGKGAKPIIVTTESKENTEKEVTGAAEEYKKSFFASMDPNELSSSLNAMLLHAEGNTSDAMNKFMEILKENPENPIALTFKAKEYSDKHQYDQALVTISRAIEINPHFALSWQIKSGIMKNLGKIPEAVNFLQKALEMDPEQYKQSPNTPKFWFYIGTERFKMGQFDEALFAFDKVIELEPENPHAWTNKGLVLADGFERYQEAMECQKKAVEIDPKQNEAYNNIAILSLKLHSVEESLKYINKSLEMDPQNAVSWYNKGLMLWVLVKLEEALECFNKAIALNSEIPRVWVQKGLVLKKLDRIYEADLCFTQALELDPDYFKKDHEHYYEKSI